MIPVINIPTPYNTIQTQKAIIENLTAKVEKLEKRLRSINNGCTGLSDATIDQLVNQISLYSETDIIRACRANDKVNKAIRREVKRYVAENAAGYEYEFVGLNIRAILAPLAVDFGFGKARLLRYLQCYEDKVFELKKHYEFKYCEDIQPECDKILMQRGFDLSEIRSKYGINYGTDDKPK